jgi:asparaginyl-tRNA synthetase
MLCKRISELLAEKAEGQTITANGWVRTKREAKNACFLELNDGSCLKGIQCVVDMGKASGTGLADALALIQTGASLSVDGILVPSPAAGQASEIQVASIRVLGQADPESYPLQKKAHSLEFLREISHLRARTNTFGAVTRVRSQLSFAIHSFFNERGFQLVHTPIITASDCEGAGEMFQVTTLDLEALAKSGKPVDYTQDFFGKKAGLTVSGQLNGETYATALGRIYTFGPTFRAENSNTTKHLAEFWMIEPEMAFARLEEDMVLAEDFLKYLFGWVLDKCAQDMEFFESRVQKGVIATLEKVRSSAFVHLSYTDAVKELEKKAADFEFKPFWGCDLQSEHEKHLAENVAGGPVIVTDYPREIKAFYMKQNPDGKTVRAMDVLVPRLGEIIGGSEREENLAALEAEIKRRGMRVEDYWWYLDLRRFGTVPHAGFGLGFERLIQYVTGMANIRDVIPYPRASKQADF